MNKGFHQSSVTDGVTATRPLRVSKPVPLFVIAAHNEQTRRAPFSHSLCRKLEQSTPLVRILFAALRPLEGRQAPKVHRNHLVALSDPPMNPFRFQVRINALKKLLAPYGLTVDRAGELYFLKSTGRVT